LIFREDDAVSPCLARVPRAIITDYLIDSWILDLRPHNFIFHIHYLIAINQACTKQIEMTVEDSNETNGPDSFANVDIESPLARPKDFQQVAKDSNNNILRASWVSSIDSTALKKERGKNGGSKIVETCLRVDGLCCSKFRPACAVLFWTCLHVGAIPLQHPESDCNFLSFELIPNSSYCNIQMVKLKW